MMIRVVADQLHAKSNEDFVPWTIKSLVLNLARNVLEFEPMCFKRKAAH